MNIYEDIAKILKNYNSVFESVQDNWDSYGVVDFEVGLGQATFIKNNFKIEKSEHLFICGQKNSADPKIETTVPGAMLCCKIKNDKETYNICNVHAIAFPGDKLDAPERLEQSRKINKVVEREKNKGVIVCGDFNLMPETESIKMIGKNMQNLIEKYKIKNTRSRLSPYFGKPDEQKFADYAFVSPDIKIKEFKVLEDQISDHLPLYINF
jgi:endonuclease/exonuclease/phosphatase family metal-dependent hydrolase